MTKIERVTKKINKDKVLSKIVSNNYDGRTEDFIKDGIDYVKAIKDGRMINSIASVSSSGDSRHIKFLSCEKGDKNYYQHSYYSNYNMFFESLDFTPSRKHDGYFNINGFGMDMIFDTNYRIIHSLKRLGFITDAQCRVLAQKTPTTI